MSNDYWDIVGFKKTTTGKSFGVKLGSAKKKDDGGFYLNFDALPYGEMSVAVCPPREKGERSAKPSQARDELDDGAPF